MGPRRRTAKATPATRARDLPTPPALAMQEAPFGPFAEQNCRLPIECLIAEVCPDVADTHAGQQRSWQCGSAHL